MQLWCEHLACVICEMIGKHYRANNYSIILMGHMRNEVLMTYLELDDSTALIYPVFMVASLEKFVEMSTFRAEICC